MVEAFPLAEAKALLSGQGSVPDALDLTEKAVALFATVDPAAIPEAAVIEVGLEAAGALYPVVAAMVKSNTGGLLWENTSRGR
jgi:hypothetical protein